MNRVEILTNWIDINDVKNKCESNFNELKYELERNFERMKEWRTDIGKCKINENNGDISVNSNGVNLNAKQVAVDLSLIHI